MNITVQIGASTIELIEREFFQLHGRAMTERELRRFLENDVAEIYFDRVVDGLDDAIANFPTLTPAA